jgi:hypothetical protein
MDDIGRDDGRWGVDLQYDRMMGLIAMVWLSVSLSPMKALD